MKAEFASRPEAPLTPPPSPDTTPVLESVDCMSLVAIPGAGTAKLFFTACLFLRSQPLFSSSLLLIATVRT